MKPYYQDDYVTIYNGDAMEVLPSLGTFDLLLTDPPYGLDGPSGTIGKTRKGKLDYKYDGPLYVRNVVIPIVELALSNSKRAIITPGNKMLTFYPPPASFGVLYQPAASGMQPCGYADAQPILYYGKDPRTGKTISPCSFQLVEQPERNGHPCPKPISIWTKLLYKGSLDGETILDPFAGSGTTGRAAKDLGRKAVLIEIEERFCDIAARRMAQEVLPFIS